MKKIVFVILTVLATTLLILFTFQQTKKNSLPLTHIALSVSLLQDEQSRLFLKDIKLKSIYPYDFMTDYRANFLVFYLYDTNKQVLRSGKFLHNKILFHESFQNGNIVTKPIYMSEEDITLNLPFFTSSRYLIIVDPDGNKKLEIDLKNYDLGPVPSPPNLCGNNMCDSNENLFTCFNDCKRDVRFTWEEISKYYLP